MCTWVVFPFERDAVSYFESNRGSAAFSNIQKGTMDLFSITVGAGIADFAISRIIELHSTIDSLGGVKEELADISSNLEAIQRPLAALKRSPYQR